MIEIERHIEILLLSNDCVIVPGLGGFMAHHVDARYDEGDGMFIPPLRTLGFNPQLTMNDSLLVQSYIETYDISYPEALRRIEAEASEMRQHLETEGSFELNGIGVLCLNEEGNLEFEPCEAGILTPELYGLDAFEMHPLVMSHTRKVAEGVGQETVKQSERAIVIKMSWLRNVAAVAAAVIAFFMIGTPVKNSDLSISGVKQSSFVPVPSSPIVVSADTQLMMDELDEEQEIAESSQEPAADSQESATVDSPEQTTDSQEQTVKRQEPTFCIVLASQVSQRNAEDFMSMLEAKGFHEASIMMTKFRRVVYGSYATEEEALKNLRELRSQSAFFKEGWVMKMNDK